MQRFYFILLYFYRSAVKGCSEGSSLRSSETRKSSIVLEIVVRIALSPVWGNWENIFSGEGVKVAILPNYLSAANHFRSHRTPSPLSGRSLSFPASPLRNLTDTPKERSRLIRTAKTRNGGEGGADFPEDDSLKSRFTNLGGAAEIPKYSLIDRFRGAARYLVISVSLIPTFRKLIKRHVLGK